MSSKPKIARQNSRFAASCTTPRRPGFGNRRARRAMADFQPAPEVVDDFPPTLPVGAAELTVIETYLGDLIDQLLGRAEEPKKTMKGDD